jgi:ribose 1,5-bisphosphokinase PhnN
MDSLAQYQQIIDGGGRDAQAMALLEDILGRQRTASRGAQDAIMANARARGLGGSDLEFVNRMIAQQQQATAGSRAAIDAAAMAQARKDQALQQSAQLAGQIRNTDYSQAAERAQAADAIARFNAANRQDVMSRNVGERNEAQRLNLGVSQAINSQNVDQRNRVTEQNAAAPRQRYQDLLGHAGKIANVQAGTADLKSQQDTSQQAATGSFANTLANLFSQYNKQKPGA